MYNFYYKKDLVNAYKSIRELYYSEFISIATNFNFCLFSIMLNDYHIYDSLDCEGLKIGAVRNKIISDDEIDLLTDHELLLVLNKCLINCYSIDYKRENF